MNTQDGAIHFESLIDNKQFDAAIAESTKRIQGMSTATVEAGAKMDKVYQNLSSESTNFSNVVQQSAKQELGRIEELRASITKLTEARDKSTSIEKIEEYNKRIQEETGDLNELTNAGKKQEDQTQSLTQTIGKWALSLGGAAAIIGVLKSAVMSLSVAIDAANIIGAVYKQVMYNVVTGQQSWLQGTIEAIKIQETLNALRYAGYVEDVKAQRLETQYQQKYSEAISEVTDKKKKLILIDEALALKNKEIDGQEALAIKARDTYLRLNENRTGDEESVKGYTQALIQLDALEAQRFEGTKRLSMQKANIIKSEHDASIKGWMDEIDASNKAYEVSHSISEQVKLLNDAVDAGDSAQVIAIANRIKLLEQEQRTRSEIAKAALLSAMTDGRGTLTPAKTDNINVNVPFVAPNLPGLQNASIQAQNGASNADAKQWNLDDWEAGEKKKKQQKEILQGAIDITMQLAKQVGLSDEAAQAIGEAVDALGKLSEGDLIGTGIDAIKMIISMFPNQSANFADQIERINNALAEEQRLIDVSTRKGNESTARENELADLKKIQALDEAELQKATDKKNDKVFAFGPVYEAEKKKVIELTDAVVKDKAAIEEAQQKLDDFLIGGVTENTIADSIAQGFQDGKTSVQDFADSMNTILSDAVMNVFKTELLNSPQMKVFTDNLKTFMADQVLTPEEVAKLKADQLDIVNANKGGYDALTQGLDLSQNSASSTQPDLSSNSPASQDAMTGAIKGVSEETASVLAGQVNAIRISQADSNGIMRQSLLCQVEIAANSKYLHYLEILQSIDSKMSGAGSSLKSQGLV